MGSNEPEEAKTEAEDNYETAVLEFLDKQMAAVRPSKKKNEHAEELDALVSDLLKQVITEADQPKDARKVASREMDQMLSEFPSSKDEAGPHGGHTSESSAAIPAALTGTTHESLPELEEEASDAPTPTEEALPAFTPAMAAKRRLPMVVFASAFLLAVVGFAVYHFTNTPKGAPAGESVPDMAAAAPVAPSVPDRILPTPDSMENKTAGRHEIRPAPEKNPARTSESNAAARPAQKPSVSGVVPNPAPAEQTANGAKAQSEPAMQAPAGKPVDVIPDQAEKAGTPTPALQLPLPGTALEKPALPPMPVVAAGETRSKLPIPVASSSRENSAATNLIPADPIFQVSPSYPEMAVRSRTSGLVILDLDIDAQGNVVKVTPVSGPTMLHSAAITAAMKWRYKPASLGGASVASRSRISMNFSLKQ